MMSADIQSKLARNKAITRLLFPLNIILLGSSYELRNNRNVSATASFNIQAKCDMTCSFVDNLAAEMAYICNRHAVTWIT